MSNQNHVETSRIPNGHPIKATTRLSELEMEEIKEYAIQESRTYSGMIRTIFMKGLETYRAERG